jgi:hypothetical protein
MLTLTTSTLSLHAGAHSLLVLRTRAQFVNNYAVDLGQVRLHAARQPAGRLRIAFPGDSKTGYTIVSPPKVRPAHD